MRFLPLIAGAVLFAAPAKADKFWLADPKAEQNAPEGSSPNYIEGVLIAEDDEGYRVRVTGGEILLPKDSVYKIERDELTLDAIVDAEAAQQEAGERANEERRLTQDIERREREIQVAEASARRSARTVEASLPVPEVAVPFFDPVIGVVRYPGYQSQADLMRDARVAWTLTKDRRYLKLLRQLRRLR